jgi:phage shock protein A
MAPKNTLGQVLSNIGKGIVSLLTTGSWAVEEYADKVRDAETVLDRVDEAAEQDAQLMLDKVNDALVNWNRLNAKRDDAHAGVTDWQKKAKSLAEKAKALPEGSPERNKLEDLVRQALTEVQRYKDKLVPLETALAESKPNYEEALQLVEKIGYTKEQILSERQRLDVARANADTKKALATALRGGGDLQARALLDEAREKVATIEAEATAAAEIADRLPADADQMDAEISALTRGDRVNEAFNKLMGS